ncbi:flippase [Leptospira noumeaensis]|uniref:Flippase n=1 Tax=Leptospira noumeaensis TaxID=2484964 RepID=A0A4R9I007_9LEPT|nr:flippase [Leptospira noumeaensis]TGK78432.1 flippase [Leptospira noumeaensis]
MKSIFINGFWLIIDKLLKLSVGLIVSVWIVRYLGPEWFGKFNFLNALIVLFGTLISFGSEGILVRMLVSEPEKRDEVLLSAFWIHFTFGILSVLLSFCALWILKPNDGLYFLMLILSVPSLFRCFSVVRFVFEAKLEVKFVVWAENIVFLVLSVVRVCLISYRFPHLALFITFAVEGVISSLLIYFLYLRQNGTISFHFPRLNRVKSILSDSFPLLLAGLAIILYMKVDQIMIGSILGDSQLGLYSVGVRWSEFWYFIPIGLASSFFPNLIKLKNEFSSDYDKRFLLLHGIVFWIAFLGASAVQLFAEPLINVLYGDLFQSSASILKVHIWSGIFVFLGVAGGNFFLIENLQKYTIWKSLFGLAVNVILNYLWIPTYGIMGAAVATLISQFCASTLFLFFFKDLRPLLRFQLLGLFFWNLNIRSFAKKLLEINKNK